MPRPGRPSTTTSARVATVVGFAAALASACAPRPDDLRSNAPWQPPPGGLAAEMPVRPVGRGSVYPPTPPAPRSAADVAARTAGAAAMYGLGGALMGIQCGIGVIVCGPVGLVLGTGMALAEGVASQQQDVATAEEVALAARTLRGLLEPTRLNPCLAGTLVARAGGRLGPDRPGPALHVWVQDVFVSTLGGRQDSYVRRENPRMLMTITVAASIDPPDDARPELLLPGRGSWSWSTELPRYLVATADGGRVLQGEVDVAMGVLASHVLADLFPGAVLRPPRRNGDAARALRTACPPLADAPPTGQTAPAEGVAPRG
jgi:hypothetical protein